MNIYGQPFIQLKIHSVKNRIKNIMSCYIDLYYLLYYWYDLHCDMSGDWSGEVSWFVPPLSFSQLCRPDNKKQFIKKLLSDSDYQISKANEKFLTTTVIIFFINNKKHCFYFNPLIPRVSKRWNSQTYGQKLLFILSIYDLLLPRGMRVLKEELSRKKAFMNF